MWDQSKKNILVVGHMGARALYPENTMVSFRKAIELGVDGIETDIHMTKDGRLALIHDDTVDRTTNGTGTVKDLTMQELRELDAGSSFSPAYADAKIPAFEEFLNLVKGRNLLLNIEIKDYRTCVVDKTVRMLNDFGLADTYVIACFNADITTYAHKAFGVKTQGFPSWYLTNYNDETNSHYYSVGIGMSDLTRDLCDSYREMGIDPWCWCPNDEKSVLKVIESGSTLATCDNPIPALTLLKEKMLHK